MPWLDGVNVLTPGEAANIRDNVIEGLKAIWRGMDEGMTFTNKKHVEAYIWQPMPDEDTEFLADQMIATGTRIPAAAQVVRLVAEASTSLRTAVILGPRIFGTFDFYKENGVGR